MWVMRGKRLTIIILSYSLILIAGIAQLVECKLPKLDVAGSNPVARFWVFFKPALFTSGFNFLLIFAFFII